jgi:solute carrier family 36 (proton-coupled amino acid transporter)
MIALAIFLTYSLQFYVPMEIIWRNCKSWFGDSSWANTALRVGLVSATVIIAIILPNLGPFITLIGAVCLSTLGLMFPAIIELVTFWEYPGYKTSKLWLLKNGFLIVFGLVGLISGTYVSIQEFAAS